MAWRTSWLCICYLGWRSICGSHVVFRLSVGLLQCFDVKGLSRRIVQLSSHTHFFLCYLRARWPLKLKYRCWRRVGSPRESPALTNFEYLLSPLDPMATGRSKSESLTLWVVIFHLSIFAYNRNKVYKIFRSDLSCLQPHGIELLFLDNLISFFTHPRKIIMWVIDMALYFDVLIEAQALLTYSRLHHAHLYFKNLLPGIHSRRSHLVVPSDSDPVRWTCAWLILFLSIWPVRCCSWNTGVCGDMFNLDQSLHAVSGLFNDLPELNK